MTEVGDKVSSKDLKLTPEESAYVARAPIAIRESVGGITIFAYTPSASYAPGNLIIHPRGGRGICVRVNCQYMLVYFPKLVSREQEYFALLPCKQPQVAGGEQPKPKLLEECLEPNSNN